MSEITDATITPLETLGKPADAQQEQAQITTDKPLETVSKPQEESPKTDTSVFGTAVTKDEEGNFVWKSPTGSTIYKGKSESELFENMANGNTAKDEYIAKLTAPKLDAESITQLLDKQEKVSTIQFPDENKIYQSIFQKNGLDPQMINWSYAQWQQYAIDNNIPDFGISDIRQNVKQAQSIASREYAVQNTKAVNMETIEYEKEQVSELVKSRGVEFTQQQLNDVVMKAWELRKDGFLVPGIITRLAADEILRSIQSKQQTTVAASAEDARKKAEAEIAAAQSKLRNLPIDGGSRTDFSKQSDVKASPNTRVAAQEAMKSWQQTHR